MRQNVALGVSLAITILLFCGGATYVVVTSHNQRSDICKEVQELRDDVIQVLDLFAADAKKRGVIPPSQEARKILERPKC